MSRDISTGGLLLESPSLVAEHAGVSFVMNLSGRKLRPIQLAGEGTVVRVGPEKDGKTFVVAIECKAPLVQIEPYLPSSVN